MQNSLYHHTLTVFDVDEDGYQDFVSGGLQGFVRYFINNKTFVTITSPEKSRTYLFGEKRGIVVNPIKHTFLYNVTLIIGGKEVDVVAKGLEPLQRVEFYLDGNLVKNDTEPPFEWKWEPKRVLFFKTHISSAVAYRENGEYGGKSTVIIWRFL